MNDLKRIAEYAIPILFVVICIRAVGVAFEPVLLPLIMAVVIGAGVYLLLNNRNRRS